MLPGGNNRLHTAPVARFLGARATIITRLKDYDDGGIALNNPTQGLRMQTWHAWLQEPYLEASKIIFKPNYGNSFVVFEASNLAGFSFSFDVNMQPVIAYSILNDQCYIRFYSTVINDFDILPIGKVITPCVALDDRRAIASSNYLNSDVIVAYVKDNNLYCRFSRDRYSIENFLWSGVPPLKKIGMNEKRRFQFEFEARY